MTASKQQPRAYDWLVGDLHNHCERHELVDEHFTGIDQRLDYVALTNHAQKPIFAGQAEMVARGRELLDIPVFFGLEWNALEGHHANVILPPCADEAELAAAFIARFDRGRDPGDATVEAALAWLAALPAEQRPVVFFNHPFPGHWADDVIARYLAADTIGDLVIGIEAVNGHQAGCSTDPAAFPGCRPGGSADLVYQTSRPFSLFSNSDFHVHKQSLFYDYPLGVFSRSVVGVPAGERTAAAIFAACRAGRTWAMLGDWLTPRVCHINGIGLGECFNSAAGPAALEIGFDLTTAAEVEVIGQLSPGQPAQVLHTFGEQPGGPVALTFPIPANAAGFVRLRVTAVEDQRPPVPAGFPGDGVTGPTLVQSSAILIRDDRS